jgi:hypothetical protein
LVDAPHGAHFGAVQHCIRRQVPRPAVPHGARSPEVAADPARIGDGDGFSPQAAAFIEVDNRAGRKRLPRY